MEREQLEDLFHKQMLDIYRRANSEASYDPRIFLRMLSEKGGLQTARDLIMRKEPSDGYTKLYLRGRLDLTVEAIVHDNPQWHSLFSEQELAMCKKWLNEYQYKNV